MQINDIKFEKLTDLGYEGNLSDMLAQYAADNSITDWYEWYGSQGATEPQFNDRAYEFWDGLVVP